MSIANLQKKSIVVPFTPENSYSDTHSHGVSASRTQIVKMTQRPGLNHEHSCHSHVVTGNKTVHFTSACSDSQMVNHFSEQCANCTDSSYSLEAEQHSTQLNIGDCVSTSVDAQRLKNHRICSTNSDDEQYEGRCKSRFVFTVLGKINRRFRNETKLENSELEVKTIRDINGQETEIGVTFHTNVPTDSNDVGPSSNLRTRIRPSSFKHPKKIDYSKSQKALRSLMIVVLAYFICMTPFSVTKLYKVIVQDRQALPNYVNVMASIFQYISSAINPLIYGIFRKDFRYAFQLVIKKLRSK